MDGLASHHKHNQSLLHIDQHVSAAISDIYPISSSSANPNLSLSDPTPHPAQTSLLNNDPEMSSVVHAHPDQQPQHTTPETMMGLAPRPEERSAGNIPNTDQHVGSISLVHNISTKDEGEALLEHTNGQIELLEGSPDVIGSGDSNFIVEEGQDWAPDPDHELKRVKVSWPLSILSKFSTSWSNAVAHHALSFLCDTMLIPKRRSTNLLANDGWTRGLPSVLGSFRKKGTKHS